MEYRVYLQYIASVVVSADNQEEAEKIAKGKSDAVIFGENRQPYFVSAWDLNGYINESAYQDFYVVQDLKKGIFYQRKLADVRKRHNREDL